MIEKRFQTAGILMAAVMFFFGASLCSAQMIVGGYRAISTTDAQVGDAATFAVKAQNRNGDSVKLKSIEKAERQIVAGSNYRLCLAVESNGAASTATAVVYHNLQNQYSLTSWEAGDCAGETKETTPNEQEAEEAADSFSGKLQVGKTSSSILYLGEESGDYAAFCFTNASAVGRKILAACKNGEQCEFTGKINYDIPCKVPGLEASLSAQGKIVSVSSVKSLAKRRTTKKAAGKR